MVIEKSSDSKGIVNYSYSYLDFVSCLVKHFSVVKCMSLQPFQL